MESDAKSCSPIVHFDFAVHVEGNTMPTWNGHFCRCREELYDSVEEPSAADQDRLRAKVEPWLAALVQSEHLSLLVGNGLTTATARGLGEKPVSMELVELGCDEKIEAKLKAHANRTAVVSQRGAANIEDELRSIQAFIEALRITKTDEAGEITDLAKNWIRAYEKTLEGLVRNVVETERRISKKLCDVEGADPAGLFDFLLSFANRPPTRERLEIFTTNYDRLIEHACDQLGIRLLDRFVGTIAARFRASRLSVDMHFDPPGIRGEPRYLEGVARFTKLHGSLDWRFRNGGVDRISLPFGPPERFPGLTDDLYQQIMIYPNAAKDVETLSFPYAELFRDFAAALCRPNSTLFVYGYGFGDDHINRVIRDMLTISSTHLVIISYDDCGGDAGADPVLPGRLQAFWERAGHKDQITLLVGKHFADLKTLTRHYLPRTLVEPIRQREARIREQRSDQGAPADGSAVSNQVGEDAQ